jgi:hypothetical protein
VAAKVEGDETEVVRERAVELPGPAQEILRPAVNEQDWQTIGSTPLANVQPQAVAA